MTVHLVDASPYVFRAYFALPDSITGPDGRPVNAVRGFADFLVRLVAEESPTHLGVAFDESLTTSFRNDFFPDYKAQRALPPPELEAQLEACREMAEALGAATYADERFEADDLIATLVAQLREAGHGAVVVSNDKDLAQLVSDDVAWLDFARGTRYTPAGVEEKFGVRPDQIADLLGLAGDSVDNIPGVKGVGKKTAVALLRALGNIEGIYELLDEVADLPIRGAGSVRTRLEADRENAFLSKRLATTSTDAPAPLDLEALRYTGPDVAALDPLLARLGLEGMRGRMA